MKDIRGFLDSVVESAKSRRARLPSDGVRAQGSAATTGEYIQDCPESLRNAIRGCRRLAFFLEAKSSVQDDYPGGRSPTAPAQADDHFDGFSATKSSDFLIDLEGDSMDHAPDVRPYLLFLGIWFSKRYLPPGYRDKSEDIQADYYVQKGKALLRSCWKRGKGFFLEPSDDMLAIHRNFWRHGTMPWLFHLESIIESKAGVKLPPGSGPKASVRDLGGIGQIRMGEISVILTNLRMPLLPLRCLAIRPTSHPDEWDEMVLRNYNPRHHSAAHWQSTTYISSMEVLYRSSKLFQRWTSPYHARIMEKMEAFVEDRKTVREQVNDWHRDYDFPGLCLRELPDLPVFVTREGTLKTDCPIAVGEKPKVPLQSINAISPADPQDTIESLGRRTNIPHTRIMGLPPFPIIDGDIHKFRYFRKDRIPPIDVNKYPGYPLPGYVHFDGLNPRNFFIELHGDNTDWEPDVRPYLLAVGRYALHKELGGKLGKRPSTEAERNDAIVQLGKDYLLWRWKRGEGYFIRPRDGLLEINTHPCVKTVPWLFFAQQLADQKSPRLSLQSGDYADVGLISSYNTRAPKSIPIATTLAQADTMCWTGDLILTNLRAPLLPRKHLTIDPYINEPSWNRMILTHYDIQLHPISKWRDHEFESIEMCRLSSGDNYSEWTTEAYRSKLRGSKDEIVPPGAMAAIPEDRETV